MQTRVRDVYAAREVQGEMHERHDRAHASHAAPLVARRRQRILRLGERRHVPSDVVAPALRETVMYSIITTERELLKTIG